MVTPEKAIPSRNGTDESSSSITLEHQPPVSHPQELNLTYSRSEDEYSPIRHALSSPFSSPNRAPLLLDIEGSSSAWMPLPLPDPDHHSPSRPPSTPLKLKPLAQEQSPALPVGDLVKRDLILTDGDNASHYSSDGEIQKHRRYDRRVRVAAPPQDESHKMSWSLDDQALPSSSLPPIPVRRTRSSITPGVNARASPLSWKRRSPSSFLRRLSGSAVVASVSPNTSKPPLTSSYAFRRQASLPVTQGERLHHIPTLRMARTDSSSSLSSEHSFLEEEDLLQLAKQLSTPTSKKRSRSFFSAVRRSRAATPEVVGHPTEVEETDAELGLISINKDTEVDASGVGIRQRPLRMSPRPNDVKDDSNSSTSSTEATSRQLVLYALYLSAFSICGSTVRVFVGRLFGRDCEFQNVSDAFSRVAKHICVTASGRTEQTGGALFSDLPANILGCFVMGVLFVSVHSNGPPLPWFPRNHTLQHHHALQVAIKVGFCGCLTTFASWNSQMVVMLNGTNTVLGRQIAPALFGYLLGLMSATASFKFGHQVYQWLYQYWRLRSPSIETPQPQDTIPEHPPNINRRSSRGSHPPWEQGISPALHDTSDRPSVMSDVSHESFLSAAAALTLSPVEKPMVSTQDPNESNVEEGLSTPSMKSQLKPLGDFDSAWCSSACFISWTFGRRLPFALAIGLISIYILADLFWGIHFYREMWMGALLTPPGALLRWNLAKCWNNRRFHHRHSWDWLPWGTLAANVLASVVSIAATALEIRYSDYSSPWTVSFLRALAFGFAGSLSTVSSLVKEMMELSQNYPGQAKPHIYGVLTIVISMTIGLCAYSLAI